MKNELNRENCLPEVVLDGIRQYDISSYGLSDFNFGTPKITTVRYNEIGRADLVSRRVYGTQDLWWFVMWYNGFSDEIHDLQDGTAIKYFNAERVKAAIRYVKDRVNKESD